MVKYIKETDSFISNYKHVEEGNLQIFILIVHRINLHMEDNDKDWDDIEI